MYTNFKIKCKLWVLFAFFRDRGIQIILKKEKRKTELQALKDRKQIVVKLTVNFAE